MFTPIIPNSLKVIVVPKTREQIASELGISVTTLWRKMREKNISLPKGLVFPDSERKIYSLFYLTPSIVDEDSSILKRDEKK